ncbi:MAG: 2-C-methyl-D-erythritol 4-phosphate cytidylyltransferase [Pyrinomonadaceae bacterium]
MNTAIIVAAGKSQRFGCTVSKQFFPLLGKPLIIHTLEQFESCPVVDAIVIVLSDAGREEFSKLTDTSPFNKIKAVVSGGETRAESVAKGLAAIDLTTAGVVAVHDGARPLVTVEEITRTIEKAIETGAACLVADVTDTIKEVTGNKIVRTIDRRSLRRALTPQAFRYDVLRRAFDNIDLDGSITDECSLVERLGVEIAVVEGSGRNIKVTRAEDVVFAEAILRDRHFS